MQTRYLGILTNPFPGTPPFAEKDYFTTLTRVGAKHDIAVFVFHIENVNFAQRSILGYHLTNQGWKKSLFPFPQLIYDRCFYITPGYYQKIKRSLQRLKEDEKITFLNYGLHGKWQVYQLLSQYKESKAYLPPQDRYKNPEQLDVWLAKYGKIILKPLYGSHGRGVFRLLKDRGYLLEGRDFNNHFIKKSAATFSKIKKILIPYLSKKSYLIQTYLNLTTPKGAPFDIRIFIQKNREGKWEIIGSGARVGPVGKITSNLHGGGTVYPIDDFLETYYPSKYEEIIQQLQLIGSLVPLQIEESFGPLFELGIDLGIDEHGKVWILEVNSKPGREIFLLLGDRIRYSTARTGPIHYASYLLEKIEEGNHVNFSSHANTLLHKKEKL